jgi:molybdopterin/thiamine biosynthesis adenylyltransferase/rhodanese-related sulfurtransferase
MTDKSTIATELPVQEAAGLACPARPLIDIRSSNERQTGVPGGAISIDAEEFLLALQSKRGQLPAGGFILCAEGVRSRQLVEQLRAMGIDTFISVAGGFRAWMQEGLPTGYPQGLDASQAERYARHLVMPQVGPEGQRKLLQSRMLLVGIGGLNSPVALYLAAAGVGRLGLLDDDTVERNNLQRQIVHGETRIGQLKTESAAESIRALNPEIDCRIFNQRLDADNAETLVAGWDLVIDGSDNFPVRYALNDACLKQGIPLVYGAVMRFQGQVSVFWPDAPGHAPETRPPCFRCMIPQAPSAQDTPGCAVAGVLGVLPGIVGTLQATEALKLALNIGRPLIGRLLMFDALQMDFRDARVKRLPNCPACARASVNRP